MSIRFSGSSIVLAFPRKVRPDPALVEKLKEMVEADEQGILTPMEPSDKRQRFVILSGLSAEDTLGRFKLARKIINLVAPGSEELQQKASYYFGYHPNMERFELYM